MVNGGYNHWSGLKGALIVSVIIGHFYQLFFNRPVYGGYN